MMRAVLVILEHTAANYSTHINIYSILDSLLPIVCAWGDPAGGMGNRNVEGALLTSTHICNTCLHYDILASTDQASSRMASHFGVVLGWVQRCGSIVETKDSWWFEWAVASSASNGSIGGAESKKEFRVDLVGFEWNECALHAESFIDFKK